MEKTKRVYLAPEKTSISFKIDAGVGGSRGCLIVKWYRKNAVYTGRYSIYRRLRIPPPPFFRPIEETCICPRVSRYLRRAKGKRAGVNIIPEERDNRQTLLSCQCRRTLHRTARQNMPIRRQWVFALSCICLQFRPQTRPRRYNKGTRLHSTEAVWFWIFFKCFLATRFSCFLFFFKKTISCQLFCQRRHWSGRQYWFSPTQLWHGLDGSGQTKSWMENPILVIFCSIVFALPPPCLIMLPKLPWYFSISTCIVLPNRRLSRVASNGASTRDTRHFQVVCFTKNDGLRR